VNLAAISDKTKKYPSGTVSVSSINAHSLNPSAGTEGHLCVNEDNFQCGVKIN